MCLATIFPSAGFAMLETASGRTKGAANALNRSVEGSRLPSSLLSLMVGYAFSWSLEGSQPAEFDVWL